MSKLPVIALVAAPLLSGQVAAETVSTTDQHFVRESKVGQWKASKTLGLKVYNDKNENIGQVTELLFNKEGQIEAVIIGVGGFLGVGKREIAVPLSEIKSPSQEALKDTSGPTPSERGKSENKSNNDEKKSKMGDIGTPPYAVLKMSSDDLKSAPEFKMVQ